MDILTALNVTRHPKRHSSLLDEAMPNRLNCASDPNNVCKAVTVTLRPSMQKLDPELVRYKIANLTKKIISSYKKKAYVEIHYEFTKAMVLHMHLTAIGPRSIIGRLIANYRRDFGHVLVKDMFNAKKWQEYCTKEDVYLTTYVYN